MERSRAMMTAALALRARPPDRSEDHAHGGEGDDVARNVSMFEWNAPSSP